MPPVAMGILAAGSSARLGQPKQLLEFGGETLIARCVRAAEGSLCCLTIAVLGAYEEQVGRAINACSARIISNQDWQEGIASSIRQAVRAVTSAEPFPDALILANCDQPFVSSELINRLIVEYERCKKLIVACSYAGTVGAPALFDKACFDELLALTGTSGAKRVIEAYPERVATVDFPEGHLDIDTRIDYEKLLIGVQAADAVSE